MKRKLFLLLIFLCLSEYGAQVFGDGLLIRPRAARETDSPAPFGRCRKWVTY